MVDLSHSFTEVLYFGEGKTLWTPQHWFQSVVVIRVDVIIAGIVMLCLCC